MELEETSLPALRHVWRRCVVFGVFVIPVAFVVAAGALFAVLDRTDGEGTIRALVASGACFVVGYWTAYLSIRASVRAALGEPDAGQHANGVAR